MRKPVWFLWGGSGLLLLFAWACRMSAGDPSTLPTEPPPTIVDLTSPVEWGIPPTVTPTLVVLVSPTPTVPQATATTKPAATATLTATVPPPTATATPTVSASATPTPAAPGPSATPTTSTGLRPGPRLVAYALKQPLTIDGHGQDWPTMLPWYPVEHVTYGHANYQGPRDLHGQLRVAWDANYLYLFWDVTDDVFVQTQHAALLYKGDSAEILVDTNLAADYYTRYLSPDDYQIGFSPGSPPGHKPEAWLWYPRSLAGPVVGARIAAQATDKGYTIEVALPWYHLNLAPFAGLKVGFAASISDNDLPGSALQQTLISTSPFRHLTDPTTWGELLLAAQEY